jgi:hypothetical protein
MPNSSEGTARIVFATFLLAVATASAGAQSNASPQAPPATKAKKPLVLNGCVAADLANPQRYVLRDAATGVAYRLNGVKVYAYQGRRVRIVGGLYPTANLAAQGGGVDPTKAAMAAMTPNANAGNPEPLEFRVSQVRAAKGSCPP